MDNREFMELNRDDPEVQKAKSFIKLIMIAFDGFYPSLSLCENSFKEKQYLRSKFMDGVSNIARFEVKEREFNKK